MSISSYSRDHVNHFNFDSSISCNNNNIEKSSAFSLQNNDISSPQMSCSCPQSTLAYLQQHNIVDSYGRCNKEFINSLEMPALNDIQLNNLESLLNTSLPIITKKDEHFTKEDKSFAINILDLLNALMIQCEEDEILITSIEIIGSSVPKILGSDFLQQCSPLLKPVNLPSITPNDLDIRFYILPKTFNQHPKKKRLDLDKFSTILNTHLSQQFGITPQEVIDYVFIKRHLTPEDGNLFSTFTIGNASFQLELLPTLDLKRDCLFTIHDLKLNIMPYLEKKQISIRPYGSILKGFQALFDLCTKTIRAENPETINFNGWPRLLSSITKGFIVRQPDLNKILYNTTFKSSLSINEEDIIEVIKNCIEKQFTNDSQAIIPLLCNAIILLHHLQINNETIIAIIKKLNLQKETSNFNDASIRILAKLLDNSTNPFEDVFPHLQLIAFITAAHNYSNVQLFPMYDDNINAQMTLKTIFGNYLLLFPFNLTQSTYIPESKISLYSLIDFLKSPSNTSQSLLMEYYSYFKKNIDKIEETCLNIINDSHINATKPYLCCYHLLLACQSIRKNKNIYPSLINHACVFLIEGKYTLYLALKPVLDDFFIKNHLDDVFFSNTLFSEDKIHEAFIKSLLDNNTEADYFLAVNHWKSIVKKLSPSKAKEITLYMQSYLSKNSWNKYCIIHEAIQSALPYSLSEEIDVFLHLLHNIKKVNPTSDIELEEKKSFLYNWLIKICDKKAILKSKSFALASFDIFDIYGTSFPTSAQTLFLKLLSENFLSKHIEEAKKVSILLFKKNDKDLPAEIEFYKKLSQHSFFESCDDLHISVIDLLSSQEDVLNKDVIDLFDLINFKKLNDINKTHYKNFYKKLIDIFFTISNSNNNSDKDKIIFPKSPPKDILSSDDFQIICCKIIRFYLQKKEFSTALSRFLQYISEETVNGNLIVQLTLDMFKALEQSSEKTSILFKLIFNPAYLKIQHTNSEFLLDILEYLIDRSKEHNYSAEEIQYVLENLFAIKNNEKLCQKASLALSQFSLMIIENYEITQCCQPKLEKLLSNFKDTNQPFSYFRFFNSIKISYKCFNISNEIINNLYWAYKALRPFIINNKEPKKEKFNENLMNVELMSDESTNIIFENLLFILQVDWNLHFNEYTDIKDFIYCDLINFFPINESKKYSRLVQRIETIHFFELLNKNYKEHSFLFFKFIENFENKLQIFVKTQSECSFFFPIIFLLKNALRDIESQEKTNYKIHNEKLENLLKLCKYDIYAFIGNLGKSIKFLCESSILKHDILYLKNAIDLFDYFCPYLIQMPRIEINYISYIFQTISQFSFCEHGRLLMQEIRNKYFPNDLSITTFSKNTPENLPKLSENTLCFFQPLDIKPQQNQHLLEPNTIEFLKSLKFSTCILDHEKKKIFYFLLFHSYLITQTIDDQTKNFIHQYLLDSTKSLFQMYHSLNSSTEEIQLMYSFDLSVNLWEKQYKLPLHLYTQNFYSDFPREFNAYNMYFLHQFKLHPEKKLLIDFLKKTHNSYLSIIQDVKGPHYFNTIFSTFLKNIHLNKELSKDREIYKSIINALTFEKSFLGIENKKNPSPILLELCSNICVTALNNNNNQPLDVKKDLFIFIIEWLKQLYTEGSLPFNLFHVILRTKIIPYFKNNDNKPYRIRINIIAQSMLEKDKNDANIKIQQETLHLLVPRTIIEKEIVIKRTSNITDVINTSLLKEFIKLNSSS